MLLKPLLFLWPLGILSFCLSETAGSAKNHFSILHKVDQMTLALSPLEAIWRTKKRDTDKTNVFIWWGTLGPNLVMNTRQKRLTKMWNYSTFFHLSWMFYILLLKIEVHYIALAYGSVSLSLFVQNSVGVVSQNHGGLFLWLIHVTTHSFLKERKDFIVDGNFACLTHG